MLCHASIIRKESVSKIFKITTNKIQSAFIVIKSLGKSGCFFKYKNSLLIFTGYKKKIVVYFYYFIPS